MTSGNKFSTQCSTHLIRTAILRASLVVVFGCAVACTSLAKPSAPEKPQIPAELAAKVQIRGHSALGELTVVCNFGESWTDAEWQSLASIPLRTYAIGGRKFDNAALAKLAELPVEHLLIEGTLADDEGAAAFAKMRSLRSLFFSHTRFGAATAKALSQHPALETFRSDGRCGATGMEHISTAPHLRVVRLMHSAANNESAQALANHPGLEILSLNSSNSFSLNNDALSAIATIRELRELTLTDTVLNFEQGLVVLQKLPKLKKLALLQVGLSDDDYAKLQAALPQVEITWHGLTAEQQATWHKRVAYQNAKEERAKLSK